MRPQVVGSRQQLSNLGAGQKLCVAPKELQPGQTSLHQRRRGPGRSQEGSQDQTTLESRRRGKRRRTRCKKRPLRWIKVLSWCQDVEGCRTRRTTGRGRSQIMNASRCLFLHLRFLCRHRQARVPAASPIATSLRLARHRFSQ